MKVLRRFFSCIRQVCYGHGTLLTCTASQFKLKVATNPGLRLSTFTRTAKRRLGKLTTMKLDTPEFHSLFTPEQNDLIKVFKQYDYEIRIAGGAVRDLVMGSVPADVDFATTATPDQMKAMFDAEKIRMINTKGEKHGTITARINDKENFEVTTLRIDVETDGRHAKVEFTKDWQLDANRRDLTVNAMFLGFDGTIYDYFNGQEDLKNRRIRFVGDANERIREDYLRILRYFRFCGRICEGVIKHDEEAVKAIHENIEGLSGISGERIWMELKKLVCGRQAGSLMETMLGVDMAPHIGLPKTADISEFQAVWRRCHNMAPQPMTLLSALLKTEEDVYTLNNRLKMSTDELKLGLFIVNHKFQSFDEEPMKKAQYLMVDTAGKDVKVKDRICELFKYKGEEGMLKAFSAWTMPRFPVTGYDLVTAKVPKGPIFAKTLNELRQLWKESDFTMSKEDLLSHIDEVVEKIKS